MALVLVADAIAQQNLDVTPGYLAWVEQIRPKLDVGLQAAE